MPRTLPWLESSTNPKAAKTHLTTRTKRRRAAEAESNSDNGARPWISTSRRAAISRSSRTPSTSPPPEPPSQEYMIDGLDNDDIYIMVEDEFYAMAKKFTQHLHHAEYLRLTKLAKSRHASTITTLSRPTDSITTMTEETKKRREKEGKAAKQKVALDQILGRSNAQLASPGRDEEAEGDKDDELWAGTTLHGLMTSPNRKSTSLTGLQKVRSGTRAAAGFTMPQIRGSQPTQSSYGQEAAVKSSVSRNVKPAERAVQSLASQDDSSTAEDDDDLDAPVSKARVTSPSKSRKPLGTVERTKQSAPWSSSLPGLSDKVVRSTHVSKKQKPETAMNKSKSADDDLDNFMLHALSTPYSKRAKRKVDLNANLGELSAEKIGSVNEIPNFLV